MPDPVRSGLVASFNRPAGNITRVAALTIELDPKRLELLHELAPSGGPLAVLLNQAGLTRKYNSTASKPQPGPLDAS
jgi:putative ABC transport system substrate-binding protein